jgi:Ca2+-binding EF-hand superfamily protein
MAKEITLAQLQTMVERSGLKLTDEEVEKLLPGINRSHNQIMELRKLITDSIEPASAFAASRIEKEVANRWRS